MGTFSKASLEELRQRIDLLEVLSQHVKFTRSGSSYKALCPFHEERTPSFIIQKNDRHYHCFGCGAHGDAIQFLMTYLKLSFTEAVESLAERFQVPLEETSVEKSAFPPKQALKEALEKACQFYRFCLLHTPEGHAALDYLYSRGISLRFIREFQIGFAPKRSKVFLKTMWAQKVSNKILEEVGLLSNQKEFFSDRITIPIRDALGAVIGFSARKYRSDGFGGKYINTPETPLFKKSKLLFGLNYSRKKITKEKRALIVEGQIDALRLIDEGFDWTVAGQGTAFGEEMVKELVHLGVKRVHLGFDPDTAGREAAMKVGDLFQKEGVEVFVIDLPPRLDPDSFLQERGPKNWQKLMEEAKDYLTFLLEVFSQGKNLESPAVKNDIVRGIAERIRHWDHPLMVHESLRRLAQLTKTPESLISSMEKPPPQTFVKRFESVSVTNIDPDRILEADLLRWLFLMGESCPKILEIARENLPADAFKVSVAKSLYEKYFQALGKEESTDILRLAIDLEQVEQQLFLSEVLQKRVNRDKALPSFIDTVQKILERNWMQKREEIKLKIFSGTLSEEEVLEEAKKFDRIKRERPVVVFE